eukprot:TRINITY_DN15606_c0_g1_i1.p1 TRINITY_DN15606_c0_g1~~TRINITY_DN15606_c0_g1_i1.p1  ORF type:complete len:106 (-),score=2.66 TRINITY_DN15606_c0_g1_i1:106-423(-)
MEISGALLEYLRGDRLHHHPNEAMLNAGAPKIEGKEDCNEKLKIKPHLCPICHTGFARRYDAKVHLRVHTNERPYKCRFCDKTFRRSSGVREHERNVHQPQPPKH